MPDGTEIDNTTGKEVTNNSDSGVDAFGNESLQSQLNSIELKKTSQNLSNSRDAMNARKVYKDRGFGEEYDAGTMYGGKQTCPIDKPFLEWGYRIGMNGKKEYAILGCTAEYGPGRTSGATMAGQTNPWSVGLGGGGLSFKP